MQTGPGDWTPVSESNLLRKVVRAMGAPGPVHLRTYPGVQICRSGKLNFRRNMRVRQTASAAHMLLDGAT
jgi:hypothetical protein